MNFNALSHQIEQEMQRQAIFELVILLIFLAIMFWLTYIVIKAAIRDGIKESGLVRRWSDTVRDARAENEGAPPMRTD